MRRHVWRCLHSRAWEPGNEATICVCFYLLFRFGPGKGQIWLNKVMCNGTEYFIQDCQNLGWGEAHCTHAEDAGVMCQRKWISICLPVCLSVCLSVFLLVCLSVILVSLSLNLHPQRAQCLFLQHDILSCFL